MDLLSDPFTDWRFINCFKQFLSHFLGAEAWGIPLPPCPWRIPLLQAATQLPTHQPLAAGVVPARTGPGLLQADSRKQNLLRLLERLDTFRKLLMLYLLLRLPSPQPTTAAANLQTGTAVTGRALFSSRMSCSPMSTSGSRSRLRVRSCFCLVVFFSSSFAQYSSSVTLTGQTSWFSCKAVPRCSHRQALVTCTSFLSSCSNRNFRATCSRFLWSGRRLTGL